MVAGTASPTLNMWGHRWARGMGGPGDPHSQSTTGLGGPLEPLAQQGGGSRVGKEGDGSNSLWKKALPLESWRVQGVQ